MIILHEILNKIDQYKANIDSYRPLSLDNIRRLDEYYRIGFTYASNALEGNSLTISETKIILEDGLTVNGKPLVEHLEAIGHSEAYSFMLKIARMKTFKLSEDIILNLHKLFYYRIDEKNAGVFRDSEVYITGSSFIPPSPKDLPNLIKKFIINFNKISKENIHPVILSAFAHIELVNIHPFIDGNGRTARLLLNLILINNGYQLLIIPPVLRHQYIDCLEKVHIYKNKNYFYEFIANCELTSQIEYCRLLKIEPV
jgi:Fic family protein